MPVKFSKAFARRRSSGNVLDATDTPPEPSFRVLERPNSDGSHDGFESRESLRRRTAVRPKSSPLQHQQQLRQNQQSNRPGSFGDGSLESNLDHTFKSAYTAERDSYASTNPSSMESRSQENVASPEERNTRPSYEAPSPVKDQARPSFSLKAATRSFSFGLKARNNVPLAPADPNAAPTRQRERAMTASSYASTATPPKLDLGNDSTLGLGDADFGTGFGDMFSKRKSTILEEPPLASPTAAEPRLQSGSQALSNGPSRTDSRFGYSNTGQPLGSPQSFDSNASDDRLISSPRDRDRENSPSRLGYNASFPNSDAALVMDAIHAGRFLNQPKPQDFESKMRTRQKPVEPVRGLQPRHTTLSSNGSSAATAVPRTFTPSLSVRDADEWSYERTPRANDLATNPDDEPLFDPSKSARLAQLDARRIVQPQQANKVMTRAEFEQYKQAKQNGHLDDDAKSTSSESDANYEDEDETEKNRQAARLRRKQEAHLAVYRQQMMKVTGEQPSDLPSDFHRPRLDRSSQSTPNLYGSTFAPLDFTGPGAKSSDDGDDDDDVPLGVLQAHGFPSKTRPPTRLTSGSHGSRPSTQLSSYPAPPNATRNETAAGGGGSLPPFAKHLPTDPYIGASLVNQAHREPMQHSGGLPQQAPGGMPPGGLVGVIAGEERARALRRGSPNTRGTYDAAPSNAPSQLGMPPMPMPGMHMMPGMPGMMPMGPSDQATANMTSQMQQFMQMQMQWMQQMMQMQGLPHQPQAPQAQQNGFLAPPGMQQRPMSQASGGSDQRDVSNMSFNGFNGRMSQMNMLNPMGMGGSSQSVYGMPGPAQGYTASIAPSERSNVGQPTRYRPVNTPGIDGSRTSSMSHQTLQGLNSKKSQSRLGDATNRNTIRAVDKPKHGGHASDEEDEEGWAELNKKKAERQSRWLKTKTAAADSDAGLEGLYYDG